MPIFSEAHQVVIVLVALICDHITIFWLIKISLRVPVTVQLRLCLLGISSNDLFSFFEFEARNLNQLRSMLLHLSLNLTYLAFLESDKVLNSQNISLKNKEQLSPTDLYQKVNVYCKVSADQADAHVTDFVSILWIRDKICKAEYRVHDPHHHGLVEKLNSSLMN